jgi:hypothetical protein
MKIINKCLFIQIIQIIFPLYFICFFLYIIKLLGYIYIKNKNIKIKNLTDKINIYNYNQNNNSIVIINGGGLIFEDCTDITIVNNILPKLNNYNIIVIKYNLFNKLSETIKEVNNTFKLLLTYNFNIKVFIGNSIGCTILLELFKIHKQFIKEKLILLSPVVNRNVKYNKNTKKDFINYNIYNYIKNKYYDKDIIIDCNSLPNTFIICGENEIFYYDIINFHNKCKNSKLYCIKNGVHSEYIIYGFLNLSKINKITNEIISFIGNDN